LEWLPTADASSGLPLVVSDKGRLKTAGQAVTWVIQSDGLEANPSSAQDHLADMQSVLLNAQVTGLRSLGEISLATLQLQALHPCPLQLTLSGAHRQQLQLGQSVTVRLDCRWIHVMPVRS
jgi:molybdate transport system ATP-binding protein